MVKSDRLQPRMPDRSDAPLLGDFTCSNQWTCGQRGVSDGMNGLRTVVDSTRQPIRVGKCQYGQQTHEISLGRLTEQRDHATSVGNLLEDGVAELVDLDQQRNLVARHRLDRKSSAGSRCLPLFPSHRAGNVVHQSA